jgi:hypothetical protein
MAFNDCAKAHALKVIGLKEAEGQRKLIFPRAARRIEIANRLRRKAESLERNRERMRGDAIVRVGFHARQPYRRALIEYRAGRCVLVGFKRRIALL